MLRLREWPQCRITCSSFSKLKIAWGKPREIRSLYIDSDSDTNLSFFWKTNDQWLMTIDCWKWFTPLEIPRFWQWWWRRFLFDRTLCQMLYSRLRVRMGKIFYRGLLLMTLDAELPLSIVDKHKFRLWRMHTVTRNACNRLTVTRILDIFSERMGDFMLSNVAACTCVDITCS